MGNIYKCKTDDQFARIFKMKLMCLEMQKYSALLRFIVTLELLNFVVFSFV
jgi:hypothetical protein